MTQFKISHIELIPITIKLEEPFIISLGPITHAQNMVVKIFLKNGMYGIGECSPYPTIHRETQQSVINVGRNLSNLLLGQDCRELKKLNTLLENEKKENACAKSAFDMALYDLNAKVLNLPLYQFLGGSNNKEIYTDRTVSLMSIDEMVLRAKRFVEMGFPVLKIKLGDIPSQNDVDRLRAIREEIGLETPLRLDANQGWNLREAQNILPQIEELNIQHCEAPLPAADILGRKKLRGYSSIPIMADEGVFNHIDAFQNLKEDAVDRINIKLGKSGGIENALKISALAESANVQCQVGSFSESRVGISALVHFSLASKAVIYYDLDYPLMFAFDPVEGGMKYTEDWQVFINDSPGIGADFDPKFLSQFDSIWFKS